MKTFRIGENIEIVCEWKKTRTAFKHEATLLINGSEDCTTKICYQNRTWESYEFESVIQKLLDKSSLSDAEKQFALDTCAGKSQADLEKKFEFIGTIAKMGEVFGKDQKEKNDWKSRMLKAGLPGLSIPEDWDQLSEDEKESRLNKVISNL